MTLSSITSTRQASRPVRIALFGIPGIGKTTFAAGAPSPIFLCAEDGAGFIDAKAFPKPLSWWDVLEAVETLTREEHPYKTLVIDTLDALESLCWEHVCKANGGGKNKSIEDFPYGKGYQHAVEAWEKLLDKIEYLQARRGMNLIMIAHAAARHHKDHDHDPWKRWSLKLHSKSSDVITGWVDAVLFAAPEMVAKKEGLKVRGFDTGARQLHTTSTGAHEGKNRYGLPPVLPLDWQAFADALRAAAPAPPVELSEADQRRFEILRGDGDLLVAQLPDVRQPKAREALAAAVASRDLSRLQAVIRKLHDALTPGANGATHPTTTTA